MLPVAFQSRRVLRGFNVVAVALSLAALAGVILGPTFETLHGFPNAPFKIGATTLVVGLVWAAALGTRKTWGKWEFRVGWVLSLPLAALNSQLACIWLLHDKSWPVGNSIVGGILNGTFYGAVVWIPSLVMTLLFFGIPLARAQRMAAKGLAGEEKGERLVGAACSFMSIVALILSFNMPTSGRPYALTTFAEEIPPTPLAPTSPAGPISVRVFSLIGLVFGGAAAVLAHERERRRRDFVRNVEAGAVEGYRVNVTDEGKVLVRVTSHGDGLYRVADFHEEIFELEPSGEAKRARTSL